MNTTGEKPGGGVRCHPAQHGEVEPFLRAAVVNDDEFTVEVRCRHVVCQRRVSLAP